MGKLLKLLLVPGKDPDSLEPQLEFRRRYKGKNQKLIAEYPPDNVPVRKGLFCLVEIRGDILERRHSLITRIEILKVLQEPAEHRSARQHRITSRTKHPSRRDRKGFRTDRKRFRQQ